MKILALSGWQTVRVLIYQTQRVVPGHIKAPSASLINSSQVYRSPATTGIVLRTGALGYQSLS